jgi:two-component sensor histidine kinase
MRIPRVYRDGFASTAIRTGQPERLWVVVSDDGVGFPEGFDPQRSDQTGLHLVQSLSNQLEAIVTFHSTDLGLSVVLRLPDRVLN